MATQSMTAPSPDRSGGDTHPAQERDSPATETRLRDFDSQVAETVAEYKKIQQKAPRSREFEAATEAAFIGCVNLPTMPSPDIPWNLRLRQFNPRPLDTTAVDRLADAIATNYLGGSSPLILVMDATHVEQSCLSERSLGELHPLELTESALSLSAKPIIDLVAGNHRLAATKRATAQLEEKLKIKNQEAAMERDAVRTGEDAKKLQERSLATAVAETEADKIASELIALKYWPAKIYDRGKLLKDGVGLAIRMAENNAVVALPDTEHDRNLVWAGRALTAATEDHKKLGEADLVIYGTPMSQRRWDSKEMRGRKAATDATPSSTEVARLLERDVPSTGSVLPSIRRTLRLAQGYQYLRCMASMGPSMCSAETMSNDALNIVTGDPAFDLFSCGLSSMDLTWRMLLSASVTMPSPADLLQLRRTLESSDDQDFRTAQATASRLWEGILDPSPETVVCLNDPSYPQQLFEQPFVLAFADNPGHFSCHNDPGALMSWMAYIYLSLSRLSQFLGAELPSELAKYLQADKLTGLDGRLSSIPATTEFFAYDKAPQAEQEARRAIGAEGVIRVAFAVLFPRIMTIPGINRQNPAYGLLPSRGGISVFFAAHRNYKHSLLEVIRWGDEFSGISTATSWNHISPLDMICCNTMRKGGVEISSGDYEAFRAMIWLWTLPQMRVDFGGNLGAVQRMSVFNVDKCARVTGGNSHYTIDAYKENKTTVSDLAGLLLRGHITADAPQTTALAYAIVRSSLGWVQYEASLSSTETEKAVHLRRMKTLLTKYALRVACSVHPLRQKHILPYLEALLLRKEYLIMLNRFLANTGPSDVTADRSAQLVSDSFGLEAIAGATPDASSFMDLGFWTAKDELSLDQSPAGVARKKQEERLGNAVVRSDSLQAVPPQGTSKKPRKPKSTQTRVLVSSIPVALQRNALDEGKGKGKELEDPEVASSGGVGNGQRKTSASREVVRASVIEPLQAQHQEALQRGLRELSTIPGFSRNGTWLSAPYRLLCEAVDSGILLTTQSYTETAFLENEVIDQGSCGSLFLTNPLHGVKSMDPPAARATWGNFVPTVNPRQHTFIKRAEDPGRPQALAQSPTTAPPPEIPRRGTTGHLAGALQDRSPDVLGQAVHSDVLGSPAASFPQLPRRSGPSPATNTDRRPLFAPSSPEEETHPATFSLNSTPEHSPTQQLWPLPSTSALPRTPPRTRTAQSSRDHSVERDGLGSGNVSAADSDTSAKRGRGLQSPPRDEARDPKRRRRGRITGPM